jgi:hypothetical protein
MSQSAAAQEQLIRQAQGFIGSWRLTIMPAQGTPVPALMTCCADGTLISSSLPVEPALGSPVDVLYVSSCHGTWEATGPDTGRCTFVGLAANGQGQPFGSATITSNVTLGSDGQTFTGSYHATVADPEGTTMATEDGLVQATRIAVEGP